VPASLESDLKKSAQRYPYLASRRVMRRMWAIMIHASADAMERSTSLANLRHLPSQAKVRSTTHRRGRTSKPFVLPERLMISTVQRPIFFSRRFNLSPA